MEIEEERKNRLVDSGGLRFIESSRCQDFFRGFSAFLVKILCWPRMKVILLSFLLASGTGSSQNRHEASHFLSCGAEYWNHTLPPQSF